MDTVPVAYLLGCSLSGSKKKPCIKFIVVMIFIQPVHVSRSAVDLSRYQQCQPEATPEELVGAGHEVLSAEAVSRWYLVFAMGIDSLDKKSGVTASVNFNDINLT